MIREESIHYLQTFSFFRRLPQQNGNGEVFSSTFKFNRNLSSVLLFGFIIFELFVAIYFMLNTNGLRENFHYKAFYNHVLTKTGKTTVKIFYVIAER